MASPQQAAYFPPMPDSRIRARSSSNRDRYTPGAYGNPQQADQALLTPQPYPVSPAAVAVSQQPPYPTEQPNGYFPVERPNMAQHQLSSQLSGRRPSAAMYPDGLQRSSYDGSQLRRPSHESRRSHHSERSHRSHHSHHSPRYDDDLDDVREEEYGRHSGDQHQHHHHHHHHQHHQHDKEDLRDINNYRQHVKERGDNPSRSLGGSLVSFFGPLKYLFEPRDKI